jgi:glycosyltransferase involved in cell wall biosynthesis
MSRAIAPNSARRFKAISVCIGSYNGEKYIKDQIDSIVEQLSVDDEIIVSDDGSNDKTLEILSTYKQFVRVVSQERAGGVVNNFEVCLCHAKNEIIILADQDDIWLPNRVKIIKNSLEDCDLVVLNGELVDHNLVSMDSTIFEIVNISSGFLNNLKKNTFVGCCMAFNRNILDLALPFPKYIEWHDWYLGLLAEITGKIRRIDTLSILFRRHDSNASNTGRCSTNSFARKIKIRLFMFIAVIYASIIRRYIRKVFFHVPN